MNCAGFTRPMWQWLEPAAPVEFEPGPFTAPPRFPGTAVVSAMRAFAAAQPWRATAHALTLVDSHDTMRIRTLLGDPGLVTVAFGLLATLPGPCTMLWAGDDSGLGAERAAGRVGRHGGSGPDASGDHRLPCEGPAIGLWSCLPAPPGPG